MMIVESIFCLHQDIASAEMGLKHQYGSDRNFK